jgi:hypothetical protein
MRKTRTQRKEHMMANDYKLNDKALRILDVIREHYDENPGVVITHDIRHVANDRTFIAYIVVAHESDDEYLIHTEIVRVDVDDDQPLEFTFLTEHDLDLTSEVK